MSIIENRKAFHEYFIEDRFEAGIKLEGWEVKAIRANRANIKESYVTIVNAEIFLVGSHISPLISVSSHVHPDPTRTRKLLLNKAEISKMMSKVKLAGYTLMPLNMHFKNGKIKLEIGMAKGKKQHDKRAVEKDNDAKREAAQAMKRAM